MLITLLTSSFLDSWMHMCISMSQGEQNGKASGQVQELRPLEE